MQGATSRYTGSCEWRICPNIYVAARVGFEPLDGRHRTLALSHHAPKRFMMAYFDKA